MLGKDDAKFHISFSGLHTTITKCPEVQCHNEELLPKFVLHAGNPRRSKLLL